MNGKLLLALGMALIATTTAKAAVQATFVSQTPSSAVMTVPTDTTIVVSITYKNSGTVNWTPTTGTAGYVTLCSTNAPGTQLATSPLSLNWLSTSSIVAPTSTIWSQAGSPNAANSVRLKWTAVGDDSLTGRATGYDFRINTVPLTLSNWASSSVWSGVPLPSLAGLTDSTTITGLNPDQLYYFGIRAYDEVGNKAGLSNACSQKTATTSYTFLFSLKTPSTPGLDTLYLGVYNPSSGALVSSAGPKIMLNVQAAGPTGPDVEALAGQLGGNSFADLMLYDRSAQQLFVALRDSSANRFVTQSTPWATSMPPGIGWHKVMLCDFSGDNLADAIAWEPGRGRIYGAKNLGTNSAFGPWRLMLDGYHATSDTLQCTMQSGRFRTGSRSTLMLIDNQQGKNFALGFTDTTCFQLNGPEPDGAEISDFGASPDPQTYDKYVGDINGDGLTDVVYRDWLVGDTYGLQSIGTALQFISGPNPYGSMLHEYAATVDHDYYKVVAGDFTGDGKLDLMFWAQDEARIYGTVGTGNSFTPTNGPGSFGSWLENFHIIARDRYRILTGREFPGSKDALIIEDRQTGLWTVAQAMTTSFQMVTGAYAGGTWTSSKWGSMSPSSTTTTDVQSGHGQTNGITLVAPNPCRTSATLSYTLPQSGPATLCIYDVTGRLIETVVDRSLPAGSYSFIWHPRPTLAPGVYLARLVGLTCTSTKKFIVLR